MVWFENLRGYARWRERRARAPGPEAVTVYKGIKVRTLVYNRAPGPHGMHMPQYMHMRVHEWPNGLQVLSIDLLRHLEEGVPPQSDILDELLADVEPLPLVTEVTWLEPPIRPPPPSPVHGPEEESEDGEMPDLCEQKPLCTPPPRTLAQPTRIPTPPPKVPTCPTAATAAPSRDRPHHLRVRR